MCCFCLKQEETRNHLFVCCKIANWLWTVIYLKLGKNWKKVDNIQQLVGAFGDDFKEKGLSSTIARLALCSGIYNLWKERNDITFNDHRFNRLHLIKAIEMDIQPNLNGRVLKDNDTSKNRYLASIWNVHFLPS